MNQFGSFFVGKPDQSREYNPVTYKSNSVNFHYFYEL